MSILKFSAVFAVAIASALLAAAAPPLAKVTTALGVLINGKELPQKTAPSWPVAANDQVATDNDPAILMIASDRVLLEPKTTIRIVERAGAVRLELDAGEVCLRTRNGSTLQLFASGDEMTIPAPFEGTVQRNAPQQRTAVVKPGACHFPAAGLLAHPKIVVPAVVAAGAAAGAAAARIATGEAVPAASPSRP